MSPGTVDAQVLRRPARVHAVLSTRLDDFAEYASHVEAFLRRQA
jgi:hypothetical protein